MSELLFEGLTLAGIAVRSFVLMGITACLALFCRHRSAALLHGIWTLGLAACLVTPAVMFLSPSWELAVLPSPPVEIVKPATPVRATSPAPMPKIVSWPAAAPTPHFPPGEFPRPVGDESLPTNVSERAAVPEVQRNVVPAAPSSVASPADSKWESISWENIAWVVWGVGFLVLLCHHVWQLVVMGRMARRANVIEDSEWCVQRDAAAGQLGLPSGVTMKWNGVSQSPMVVGLVRPTLLLPTDAGAWSAEKRQLVLIHELAHIQRRDLLTQSMATVACALYWFNPLAWWAAYQMKQLREIACDDAVIRHSNGPATYAQTLLDVAKSYRCRSSAAVAMARSSDVEGRIQAILSSTRNRAKLTPRLLRVLTTSAVLLAAMIGTCQVISRAEGTASPVADKSADKEAPKRKETSEKKTDGKDDTQPSLGDESKEVRTIAVQVLDKAGKPVSDVNILVNIGEMPGNDDYPNTQDYKTNDKGVANINIPRRIQLLRMWPSKAGYVPMFVNFHQGEVDVSHLIPDNYVFHTERGSKLSGRIVDDEGKPIERAKVRVSVEVDEPAWGANPKAMISTWLTDSDYSHPNPITNKEGYWSIDNAPPAPGNNKTDFQFRLQVTHPDYAGDTKWGELQEAQGITTADLRSGTAELRLKPGLAFSGKITGPEGESVSEGLVVWDDNPYLAEGVNEAAIDKSGYYKTKNLKPGKYPITVLAPGYAPWQEEVELTEETEDLDITLKTGNPLQIQFVDASGAVIPNVYVGIGYWRGKQAMYNEKHPNVPDSGIPHRAGKDGVYRWDWAPDDAVTYRIGKKGFAGKNLTLVAKSTPHIVTLASERVVSGRVTDASTGEPVASFVAMPVIEFDTDFFHTRVPDAKDGKDGEYSLPLTGSGNPDDPYRVRFEADGYRSVVSDKSFGPLDGKSTLDVALEPAPLRSGRVIDSDGNPVRGATVIPASSTEVPTTTNGEARAYDARTVTSDKDGTFQLRATTERVRVRVVHEIGFAEIEFAPDAEAFGDFKLQPWATISGRLMQGGRPIGNEYVFFRPLLNRGLTEARFQDTYSARTDQEGHFRFDRLPPIAGSVSSYLGPWEDSALTSSESIPFELKPGTHHDVLLGGDGATVTGQIIATGRSNEDLSKQWSLNYLIRRDGGVHYPKEAAPLSFNSSGNLQADWLAQPDFELWTYTRQRHFVKLADDGQFTIHGVEAGEYDLVVQLYEQPSGCLVETIGEKIIPVTITEEDVQKASLSLGNIEIACRKGPRVGSDMRAYEFTNVEGRVQSVNDMQGDYVLLHVWATWCAPCIASMPSLAATKETHADAPLTVIGLNVDDDIPAAKAMAREQKMSWAQNYLGAKSDLARQLAISTAPAYYLIGPDGKLVRSSDNWSEMEGVIDAELE